MGQWYLLGLLFAGVYVNTKAIMFIIFKGGNIIKKNEISEFSSSIQSAGLLRSVDLHLPLVHLKEYFISYYSSTNI